MLKISLDDYKMPDCIKQSIAMYSKDNDIEKCSEKGANGYLFFGQNTIMQKKVAFKYYFYGGDRQYHAEPKYLASVSSNNILKIHHAESINSEWALYITDYCKNGDLDDYFGKTNLSVKESLCIIYDILSGLCVLHSNKLVHRDLKPQNILIADNYKPVIGDFGSVKVIPDGLDCIPGSGHSLLYRPPESIIEEKYGYCSDIYQMGIVLYQLLGGELSYNASDYLSLKQKKTMQSIFDDVDKQLFIDNLIKEKIKNGKLLNLSTLPYWTDRKIMKIIRKSTSVNYKNRYQSCSEMMNEIAKIKSHVFNWRNENGIYVLEDSTNYRICPNGNKYFVQKRKHSEWRNDNYFFETGDYRSLIWNIEKIVRK